MALNLGGYDGAFRKPAFVIVTAAAFAAGMTGALSGCASDERPDEYVHCVDSAGKILPDDACDDEDGSTAHGYWLYSSTTHYPAGSQAPSGWEKSRIAPNNTAARTKAGLPKGRVAGTKISGGGFGKGAPAGNKGGGS